MVLGKIRSFFAPASPGPLLLSGLLLGLAHPPFNLLVPSFVALVPAILWLHGLPSGSAGRSEARRGGFFLGLVYYTLVFNWLLVALLFYTVWAIPAFLAPVLAMCAFLSVMTVLAHEARERLAIPLWIGLPVLWTANEWFRAHVPQVAFPWMGFGDSLAGFPALIGAADLVGSRGLSFWLVLCNALLAECVWRWRARITPQKGAAARGTAMAAPVIGLALAIAVPTGYSLVRWNTLEMRPVSTAGVVQPNVPEHLKLEGNTGLDSAFSASDNLAGQLASDGASIDLLVLPETVFQALILPIPELDYAGRMDIQGWVLGQAARFDAHVLYGAFGHRMLEGDEYEPMNSAFLANREGTTVARYDKRYLVPVVERVPFLNPKWFGGLQYFGGFGIGDISPPLRVGDASFGVMICYESIYTQLSRRFRRDGADYLVNITNDAWFGREDAWWTRTSALWQHPAHLVMRAIETRVGAVRAANTGISGIVDPLGRMHHRTELFVPAVFAAEVMTTDGDTLYVRFGDVVGWISAIAGALVWAAIVVRRRAKRPA